MLSADDLHDLRGAGASPYDSEMPTDLDGCIKESAHALGQPRVYDDTYLEMDISHVSTPDHADFAVQGARHGQHLSSPAEACTMAGLLSRVPKPRLVSGKGGRIARDQTKQHRTTIYEHKTMINHICD